MSKFSLMPQGMLSKLNVGGSGSNGGGGGEGESMFGMKNLKSAGTQIAAGLAGGMAEKVGGKAMGDAVRAGLKSKFNPYVMAGAVALGALKSRQERKKQEAIAEGTRMKEMSKAETKKGEIYGKMAKSIESTLGAGTRKKNVNL